jgi:hypothetical protein
MCFLDIHCGKKTRRGQTSWIKGHSLRDETLKRSRKNIDQRMIKFYFKILMRLALSGIAVSTIL